MVQENGGGKKRNRNRNKNKNKNKPAEEQQQQEANNKASPPPQAVPEVVHKSKESSPVNNEPVKKPAAAQLSPEERKENLVRNLTAEQFTYDYAALKEAEVKYVQMMQAKVINNCSS